MKKTKTIRKPEILEGKVWILNNSVVVFEPGGKTSKICGLAVFERTGGSTHMGVKNLDEAIVEARKRDRDIGRDNRDRRKAKLAVMAGIDLL